MKDGRILEIHVPHKGIWGARIFTTLTKEKTRELISEFVIWRRKEGKSGFDLARQLKPGEHYSIWLEGRTEEGGFTYGHDVESDTLVTHYAYHVLQAYDNIEINEEDEK